MWHIDVSLSYLGGTECFILAPVANEQYLAIYNPLLYLVTMLPRFYVPLIISCHVVGILHATSHTVATFTLSFYAFNEIRHVFCDIPPLLAISCSDKLMNQLLVFYFSGSIEISTILIVLSSYDFILLAILRMHSAEGRSLFNMWFSPNRSVHFSWYSPIHIHDTQFQLCLRL